MSDILLVSKYDATKKYLIKSIDSLIIDKKTGLTAMPLPEDEGTNTIVIGLMGAEISLSIDFTITENICAVASDSDDIGMGAGTHSVFDQLDYIGIEDAKSWFASGKEGKSFTIYIDGSGLTASAYGWSRDAKTETGVFSFEGGLTTCKASIKMVTGMVL